VLRKIVNSPKASVFYFALFIVGAALIYSFRNTDINLAEKKATEIVLQSKPKDYHFKTSAKFYDYIDFNALGYSQKFIIENFNYKASSYDLILTDLNKGDTVLVWIDNTSNHSFGEAIAVYNLQFKGKDYVNIDLRNQIKSRYNKYGLIVAFYGVFLLFNIFLKRGINLTFSRAIVILLLMIIGIYRITK
jgi:hypothetical protein